MTASLPIGAVCLPHPTLIDRWVVKLGLDERTITREDGLFVAWIGSRAKYCEFFAALKACDDDMEWHAWLHATALAEQAAAAAHNNAIPRAVRIAALSEEIELLRRSDADNSSARLAEANAKLETML